MENSFVFKINAEILLYWKESGVFIRDRALLATTVSFIRLISQNEMMPNLLDIQCSTIFLLYHFIVRFAFIQLLGNGTKSIVNRMIKNENKNKNKNRQFPQKLYVNEGNKTVSEFTLPQQSTTRSGPRPKDSKFLCPSHFI